ncbi:hypothetical protein DPMN_179333 [Dreissena polymorpha]|uniref:Uncharacterized protein n=1 Tax=Dreissena polymorpha TaxID=45954 RepID=A0A9D4EGT9_DREPO|nr:hypothetical protein DPMN_179333 [Dreissena polymorpha]
MRRRMMRQTSSDMSFSDDGSISDQQEVRRSSGGNMAQDSNQNVTYMETEELTVDQNEFMGDESLEDPGEYDSFQMQEVSDVCLGNFRLPPPVMTVTNTPQDPRIIRHITSTPQIVTVQGGQSQSVQLKQQQLQQQQAIVAHQQAQLQSSQTQLQPVDHGQQPMQIEQIKMHMGDAPQIPETKKRKHSEPDILKEVQVMDTSCVTEEEDAPNAPGNGLDIHSELNITGEDSLEVMDTSCMTVPGSAATTMRMSVMLWEQCIDV